MLLILAAALGLLAGQNATLALGAVAALVFVGLVWANYAVAVGMFIVSTFLAVPGTVAKGIGLVLVVAWFAMLTTRSSADFRDFASEHRGMTVLLLAFLFWITTGLTHAQSTSAVVSSLGRYIPNFAVFFLVYAAAEKRSRAPMLIGLFVLGAAIAAGDAVINPPSSSFYSGDLSRTGGTFGDPNYLAAVLVVGLALGAAFASLRSLLPVLRVGAMITCVLCVGGILLSVSRGGLIALAIALIAGMMIAGQWRGRLAALSALIAVVTIGYFAFYASPAAVQHLTQNNGGSGRTDIWAVGWRMVQAHPLDGVGAGNFPIASRAYLLRPGLTTHAQYILDSPKVAHNTYLELLAEGGLPALLLFAAIVAASLRCMQLAWRGFRTSGDQQMELISYALFAGLLGLLAASFFVSEEYSKQLWILLAFGPFLLRISTLPRDRDAGDPARDVLRPKLPKRAAALPY